MKRILRSVLIVALATIMYCIPAIAGTRSDYANIPGTLLYAAPDVTEEQKTAETAVFLRIPGGVRSALALNGYYYVLINEDNDKTATGHTGCTLYQGMCSHSEGRLNKDISLNGGVMNHEIGHAVDLLYGGDPYIPFQASNDPGWQALYRKYKKTIAGFGGLSKWEVYNAQEAFAEAYCHYINDPVKVMRLAPEIATYMDAVNNEVTTRYIVIDK